MNLTKQMKKHDLHVLLLFEPIYAQIEREAIEAEDPRVGHVSEQLQAMREAIYELRIEQGIPIPDITVGVQTLVLRAERCLTKE